MIMQPPFHSFPFHVAHVRLGMLLLATWFFFFPSGSAHATEGTEANSQSVQWLSKASRRHADEPLHLAREVALSDAWNKSNREGTWVYQVVFDGAVGPEPWGLYIPRIGNRVSITLNGRAVGQLGSFTSDQSDFAQRPHYFNLATDALTPTSNVLELTVQGEKARYAGVSVLAVGPAKAVHRLYFWRESLQTQGSLVIVVLSVLFALPAGALAIGMRDRVFTLFALGSMFCAIRTAYAIVIDPPFDYRLWSWAVDTAFAGYLTCLGLFCLEVVKIRRNWVLWVTAALGVLTLVLVPMHAFGRVGWARQVWLNGMLVYSFSLSLALVVNWWRNPSNAARILGITGLLAVSMGLHDHVTVFYTADGFASFAVARYSLLLFLVAMTWVLVDRYLGQHRREQAIKQQMADDLLAKTTQLKAQFEAQRKLIETSAHEQERQRLVHDLHDGLGLQLNTLLAMVEQTPGHAADMLNEVRTAIDQMRMLVDNSESFEGNFAELMGHIRHRIGSRLHRAGVRLAWQPHFPVHDDKVLAGKAAALQHLMFELTTNVIKHAKASTMTVRVEQVEDRVTLQLTVEDDGVGLSSPSADCVKGLGLRSIRKRVADLEGQMEVTTGSAGGTGYVFRFPVLT